MTAGKQVRKKEGECKYEEKLPVINLQDKILERHVDCERQKNVETQKNVSYIIILQRPLL